MLADRSLAVLRVFWAAMLRLAIVPEVVARLLVVLLPKPQGGWRPIGLFPGIVRPVVRWLRWKVGVPWLRANPHVAVFGAAGKSLIRDV